jgi:hypothetical protein
MSDDRRRRPSSKSEKVRDPRTMTKFLEELSWVLNSYSNVDFRAIPDFIKHGNSDGRTPPKDLQTYASKNPNIHFLVGVLPVIFSNERIFPSNEHIAEFGSAALGLQISRWDKRSRYELIGLIVCETVRLDDSRLTMLVKALQKVAEEDPHAQNLIQNTIGRKINWNEVIQKLTSGE